MSDEEAGPPEDGAPPSGGAPGSQAGEEIDDFSTPSMRNLEKIIKKREALNNRMAQARQQKMRQETQEKMKPLYIRKTKAVTFHTLCLKALSVLKNHRLLHADMRMVLFMGWNWMIFRRRTI